MPIQDKRPQGPRRLRFAVIADTHINQSEDQAHSFFPLNRLANARARHVAALLKELDVRFVLHLGDIVHPVPGKPSYAEAARLFRTICRDVDKPIHLVPGNHDIGDKPGPCAPVPTISSAFVETYRKTFGADFFSFDEGDCHFVIVNAPLMNSGLPEEEAQKAWLESDLASNASRRIFLAIHYPPYVWQADEPGSYDNIDEPARSWLLSLTARYGVEAMFCGHVHNFWYDQHGPTEIYLAPSTAFVRQDYSEFMRVGPPGEEGGRADVHKLGIFVVDVHERGHVAYWLRSDGAMRGEGDTAAVEVPPFEVHSKLSTLSGLGLDMRHPWAEVVELPPSGALEEFERKRARNDYPLCAVWDMGVRLMRVPAQDLLDPATRRRMEIAAGVGNRFIVSSMGIPSAALRQLLASHAVLVDSIEVVLQVDDMPAAWNALADLRLSTGRPVFLSKLRRHEDAAVDGLRYGHLIFHGWVAQDWPRLEGIVREPVAAQAIDGLTFRVGRGLDPRRVAADTVGRLRSHGLQLMLSVRIAGDDPAGTQFDDEANAAIVEAAASTCLEWKDVRCVIDTLVDVDRGYFRRSGLIDRAFNLRPAGARLRLLASRRREASDPPR
ncbi:metallophosphoesterase [Piscinibacter sakaiensis]|uniref:Calcineurin-like phosphoesterase domain-containing protein n=1 Tax=Piscinibacter sakaiensis TaxID=1547922 RepID=A0A0K8NTD4_PISS1|nr:metallophosphoesterase [Piscinibacter sakaiensis]GAP33656.1 hypothetical protein ISF6_0102 [Piscinibacter sakaiensis]